MLLKKKLGIRGPRNVLINRNLGIRVPHNVFSTEFGHKGST